MGKPNHKVIKLNNSNMFAIIIPRHVTRYQHTLI